MSGFVLLYYFRKGKNKTQIAKKSCDLYGDEALKESQGEIVLSVSVLEIFHTKISHVQFSQVKLIMTISRL